MTFKVMNTLQNYYGMCIQQNKGNICICMKKSIAALIHHYSENDDDEDRHQYLLSTN